MSKRNSDGVWTNTNQAARWLKVNHSLFRTFIWHLRVEGELAGAWDHDTTQTPVTAVDQRWIFDNWDEWSEAWADWCGRMGGR